MKHHASVFTISVLGGAALLAGLIARYENYRDLFLIIVLSAVLLEAVVGSIRKTYLAYSLDTLSNLAMMLVNRLIRPLSLAWKAYVFSLAAELPFAVQTFEPRPLVIVLTFFAAEFGYYWYHRLSHELPALWALHYTHHSSHYYNLTTAVRLNWLANFVSPVFFVPFVVVGFPPGLLTLMLALGLFYQFFLHTEVVPKLGWLEGMLWNTPSAHRVHHGSNERYLDKNYGASLILFDRLFGTYEPETEKVRYGVTTTSLGHNPLRVQFVPLWKYVTRTWRTERKHLLHQAD